MIRMPPSKFQQNSVMNVTYTRCSTAGFDHMSLYWTIAISH